ncbi:MAG TPA: MBG domain-containing protein, partial [Acidimicrobiales bacterium]|nr:MBG domain-containing protein [Acidimicrobiales bacterium]
MGSVHGRPSAGGIPARFLRALALSLVLALVWSQGAVAAGADGGAGAGRQRLLVKLDRAATADQRLAVVQRNGGSAAGWVAQLGLLVVSLPEAQADGALRRYAGDPAVARVERDQARKAAAVPNDPSYPDQWALPAIGWDTVYAGPAPAGPATVAVLDTGVDTTVADLIGRTVAGWSALGGDPAADPNGHGTRLATIAAAAAGDGAGVAGVGYAPGVRVMPVQVLGSDGTGSDGDVIAGVTWAADHGADVILMGFSNPGFSQSLQDAVDYAWSKGAVLVAATGNGASTDPTYPAGDAKVVGVSATDSADAFWTGSNAGTDAFLAAPGVNVVADSPGGGTAPVTGTSASAAVVAGAAALLTAADPAATPGTVVGRLARTAAPVGTRAQTGNGRVDLARALADNASDEVVPAGAAPVGAGGPYVGPYTAGAQLSGTLQGQSNPACSSGGICPWQTTNLQGWGELQTIPMRLDFGPGQSGTSNSFTISLDHSNSGSQGLDGFTGWTPSANVTMSPAAPAPVKAINGAGAETWSYTFTAQANNASEGWILFNTKLLAGANSFSGSSLQVKGAGTIGFVKPAAAPGTPDLTVTKTGSTDVVNGQQVTYSLAYKNVASGSANNATGVLLKDELPAALTFVAGSCTGPVACSYDSVNRVLSWPVSTLAAGGPSAATTTVTYAATVGTGLSAGSTFSNNASIFGNQVDADTSSAGHQNISVVTSTVRQNKLVFTTGAPTISAGQTTGTITVQAQDFTGAALVGPRTVTLSSTSATGAFKDSAGTTTITSVSIPAGASTASFRYTDTTAGTPTITAASSGLASAQQAVTVNSSAQATLTVTSPDAGVYGDHLGMVASGGSGSGAVTFTVDAGSTACSILTTGPDAGKLAVTAGTGTCAITAHKAGDGTYSAADSASHPVTVGKASVTITPDAGQTKVFGSSEPLLTYTHSALVNGDTDAVFSGSLVRDAGENAGAYTIRLGTLSAGSNYALVLALTPVSFTVTPQHVTVTPNAGQSKVYGASDPTLAYTLSPTVPVTGALSRNAGENAGTYAITLGGLSAGTNYALDLVPTDFTITPRTVTVTPDAGQSKVYGSADPTLTFTNDAGLMPAAFTGALSRDPGSNVGNYPIRIGDLAAASSNYTVVLSGVTVNFAITAKHVTVTPAAGQSKVYGSSDPTLAYSLSPTVPVTGALSRNAGEDVGTYAITLGNLSAGSNYALDLVPADFTIVVKAVVVTPNSGQHKTYGDTDPALGYTLSEPVAVNSGALDRVSGENVGTYAIGLGTLASTDANHTLVLSGTVVNFTIVARVVTITPDTGQSKVFGSGDPALTFSNDAGLMPAAFTGGLSRVIGENVGTYGITLGTLGSASANYTLLLAATPVSFAITAKHVTVTPTAGLSKVYGGADPVLTFALSETVAHSGALARNAGENVGTYPIVLNDLAPTSTNYVFDLAPASFAITAR